MSVVPLSRISGPWSLSLKKDLLWISEQQDPKLGSFWAGHLTDYHSFPVFKGGIIGQLLYQYRTVVWIVVLDTTIRSSSMNGPLEDANTMQQT